MESAPSPPSTLVKPPTPLTAPTVMVSSPTPPRTMAFSAEVVDPSTKRVTMSEPLPASMETPAPIAAPERIRMPLALVVMVSLPSRPLTTEPLPVREPPVMNRMSSAPSVPVVTRPGEVIRIAMETGGSEEKTDRNLRNEAPAVNTVWSASDQPHGSIAPEWFSCGTS